ncbi:MAG: hypothetical protein J6Y94_06410 [Bacteriovoracaceae bacterium]|nr:hypothetical protein [Bacteriovoracaceae bacterium]
MLTDAEDKLATEESKAQANGKTTKSEQWLFEHHRYQLILDLQEQVQNLLGQANLAPDALKTIFLNYFSINFYAADFSERFAARFDRWKKDIERYRQEDDNTEKAAEYRRKIYEHEGILHTILWEKPQLAKAFPVKNRQDAETTSMKTNKVLMKSHNPLTTAYVNFHEFIQRHWPRQASAPSKNATIP